MAIAKFELDKFNRDNEFNLWRIKMKTLLVHQGLFATLNKEELKEEEDRKSWMKVSAEVQSKAHNALILSS